MKQPLSVDVQAVKQCQLGSLASSLRRIWKGATAVPTVHAAVLQRDRNGSPPASRPAAPSNAELTGERRQQSGRQSESKSGSQSQSAAVESTVASAVPASSAECASGARGSAEPVSLPVKKESCNGDSVCSLGSDRLSLRSRNSAASLALNLRPFPFCVTVSMAESLPLMMF